MKRVQRILIIILIVFAPSISFCQKLIFTKPCKAFVNIDENDWNSVMGFVKGDTVEFIGISKVDPTYYKIKANGIISFVYSSNVSEADNYFEYKRMRMDSLRQFVVNRAIGQINKGDTVKILDANSGSMGERNILISNGQVERLASLNQIKLRPMLDSIVNLMIQYKVENEASLNNELRAAREKRLRTKFGEVIYKRMLNGEIWIGMTSEMILEMKGYPKDINRTITNSSIMEQWVYDLGKYFYFTNGKLTSWQD